MAWDSVPWLIGGGAEHSPEVARLLAYAATAGSEGIVEPGDLKVSALTVPGASVNVSPGAALIRNRASGGAQQTYVARNPTRDTAAVASTGSSKRSDLIVAQIEDPYLAGEPWQDPANPKVGPYVFTRVIPNVPAGTTRLQDVAAYAGRSAVTLARVDIPANTAAITNAMIVDLRDVAQPKNREEAWVTNGPAGYGNVFETQDGVWKTLATLTTTATIPEWATRALVRSSVSGLGVFGGEWRGHARVTITTSAGSVSTREFAIAENATGVPSPGTRLSLPFTDFVRPLTAHAGKTATVKIEIRKAGTQAGRLTYGETTISAADISWQQEAV